MDRYIALLQNNVNDNEIPPVADGEREAAESSITPRILSQLFMPLHILVILGCPGIKIRFGMSRFILLWI